MISSGWNLHQFLFLYTWIYWLKMFWIKFAVPYCGFLTHTHTHTRAHTHTDTHTLAFLILWGLRLRGRGYRITWDIGSFSTAPLLKYLILSFIFTSFFFLYKELTTNALFKTSLPLPAADLKKTRPPLEKSTKERRHTLGPGREDSLQ